jgi:hypothetical protein
MRWAREGLEHHCHGLPAGFPAGASRLAGHRTGRAQPVSQCPCDEGRRSDEGTLDAIERKTDERPALYDAIARVAPAMRSFEFQSSDAFKDHATSTILEWLPDLTGRTFHVRLHRRGPKLELRTPDAERFFNDAITEATTRAGMPAPDFVQRSGCRGRDRHHRRSRRNRSLDPRGSCAPPPVAAGLIGLAGLSPWTRLDAHAAGCLLAN